MCVSVCVSVSRDKETTVSRIKYAGWAAVMRASRARICGGPVVIPQETKLWPLDHCFRTLMLTLAGCLACVTIVAGDSRAGTSGRGSVSGCFYFLFCFNRHISVKSVVKTLPTKTAHTGNSTWLTGKFSVLASPDSMGVVMVQQRSDICHCCDEQLGSRCQNGS